MEIDDGYKFWIKIDELNPYSTLVELIKNAGLNYGSVKTQRTNNRIPTAQAIYKLAKALNTTMEYLLANEKDVIDKLYPKSISDIADKLCQLSDQDLFIVKRFVETLPVQPKTDKAQIS